MSDALRWMDLVGVFVFAVSGGALAVRKHFDIVGVFTLAGVTGLGGGIVRDLILGVSPPAAFRSPDLLISCGAAATVMMVAHDLVARLDRVVLTFDAAGLGVFALTGATRTVEEGQAWWAAVLLGTMSAVGGGVIRDVLARDVPLVFRPDSELYTIPAVGAAAAATACHQLGIPQTVTITPIVVTTFGIRLIALHRTWTAPTPRTPRTGP